MTTWTNEHEAARKTLVALGIPWDQATTLLEFLPSASSEQLVLQILEWRRLAGTGPILPSEEVKQVLHLHGGGDLREQFKAHMRYEIASGLPVLIAALAGLAFLALLAACFQAHY